VRFAGWSTRETSVTSILLSSLRFFANV
jgi:hypothetical protein